MWFWRRLSPTARKVTGETRISRSSIAIDKMALRPRRVKPLPETLEAIAEGRPDYARPGVAVHQRRSRTCW